MSAEHVAEARRILREADAKHAAAQDKVRGIRDRIEWATAKQREITQKRMAGTATEADAGEFAALGGDLDTLRHMLAEAQVNAAALDPAEARNQLAWAEQQHQREQDAAAFEALSASLTVSLKTMYCRRFFVPFRRSDECEPAI